MVYCVGLIGTIASGKTTVAGIFLSLGIEVISADNIAKKLTAKNTAAYHQIISHFGSIILLEDGALNRRQLRELIFANKNERLWLEQILHPLIRKELEQQVQLSTSPYCIVEIPLLNDKTNYPYINRILTITAPIEIQIARIVERDQCSKDHAMAIISAQSHLTHAKIADDLIINDAGLKELKNNVEQLHQKYLHYVLKNN